MLAFQVVACRTGEATDAGGRLDLGCARCERTKGGGVSGLQGGTGENVRAKSDDYGAADKSLSHEFTASETVSGASRLMLE